MKYKYYIDDKGDHHGIANMETSHLLNVIKHHEAQYSAINQYTGVHNHEEALGHTIEALMAELRTRDPREYLYGAIREEEKEKASAKDVAETPNVELPDINEVFPDAGDVPF